MTSELARDVVSLRTVGPSELALRARRLDRLRSGVAAVPVPPPAARRDRAEALAAALGGRAVRTPSGSFVVIEASGPLPLPADRLAWLPDPIDPRHPLVCLDTETTGLGTAAGTMPFLVGLGSWDGIRFTVRQLVLPDHAHERAFLDALAHLIPPDAWLVTYNGRGFDWPLLVTRFRLHGAGPPPHAGHLDLLPLARQVWRHRLPDARLSSVESGICGVRRDHDLPGAMIPERYFGYLRDGRGEALRDVVRHNRQDIASLARLLATLAEGLDPNAHGRSMHPGDVAGLGRAYLRRRRYPAALDCFDAVLLRAHEVPSADPWSVPLAERITAERARLHARLGRHAEAVDGWRSLAAGGGRLAALAWIQLAKHHEHRDRDLVAAYSAAMRATALAGRGRTLASPLSWVERDLARRVPRLRHRLRSFSAVRRPAA